MTRQIIRPDETYLLHDDGTISRPSIGMKPSGSWRIVGAHTLDNFGNVVAIYTLRDILNNPSDIPWQHKNGKQKTFILDDDHGTGRMWVSPNATII